MESTYLPEVPPAPEPEPEAPAFILLGAAEDAEVCTPDGECA